MIVVARYIRLPQNGGELLRNFKRPERSFIEVYDIVYSSTITAVKKNQLFETVALSFPIGWLRMTQRASDFWDILAWFGNSIGRE